MGTVSALTGKAGEEEAVKLLTEKGYRILERNWLFRKKEIDVIACNEACIAFIEVKTRTDGYLEAPSEAVTRTKQKYIIAAANEYIQQHNISKEVRLDVISVVLNKDGSLKEIEHTENAYYPVMIKNK